MVTKICEICGKEFNARTKTTKYCSKQCAKEANILAYKTKHQYVDLLEKNCACCGKKFMQAHPTQKFCCRKCKDEYYKRERANKHYEETGLKRSGVSGITWDRKRQAWRVIIRVNETRHQLGFFKDLEEATKKRDEAITEYAKPENADKWPNNPMRICEVCGKTYKARKMSQRVCPDCYHTCKKTCIDCGKEYITRSNQPAIRCPECRREYTANLLRTEIRPKNAPWDEERKARLAEKFRTEEKRKQLAEIQQKAIEAVHNSPIAGPFETNQNAKIWRLKSPDGHEYECSNLSLFIRNHPEWFPNATSARTALCASAKCVFGPVPPSRRGKPVCQYKGWQVLEAPREREKR